MAFTDSKELKKDAEDSLRSSEVTLEGTLSDINAELVNAEVNVPGSLAFDNHPLLTQPTFLWWRPTVLSWWISIFFIVGCVLFAIAAALNFDDDNLTGNLGCNLAGASLFLLGGILCLVETTLRYCRTNRHKTLDRNHSASSIVDDLISMTTFTGTVFFQIPSITAYLFSPTWTASDILFNINLYIYLGVAFFSAYSFLAFWKISGRVWAWKPRSIAFYPPFLFLLGGVPFLANATWALVSPNSTNFLSASAFVGSILYLGGSVCMFAEVGYMEAAKHEVKAK